MWLSLAQNKTAHMFGRLGHSSSSSPLSDFLFFTLFVVQAAERFFSIIVTFVKLDLSVKDLRFSRR
jgi:hypothetical protein